jgi:hypothetical protein
MLSLHCRAGASDGSRDGSSAMLFIIIIIIIHNFQSSTTANKLGAPACTTLCSMFLSSTSVRLYTILCRCVAWLGPGLPPTGRPWRPDPGGVSNILPGRQHPEASGAAAGESTAVKISYGAPLVLQTVDKPLMTVFYVLSDMHSMCPATITATRRCGAYPAALQG